jgi:hypothetical protein
MMNGLNRQRAGGGSDVNYARRQQYRRLSRTATAAMASGATMLLAVTVANAGAVSAAGLLLMLAVGMGLYARYWLSLAGRSRAGARSEDEVRRALRHLQAEGWRLRHSLPWRGRGDIDSLAIAPTGVAFVIVFCPAEPHSSAFRQPMVLECTCT